MQQTTTVERDALSRLGLAEARLLRGQLEEARALAEQTLALATEHHERGNQAYALRVLGEIAARGLPSEGAQALDHYRQALALADELGMRPPGRALPPGAEQRLSPRRPTSRGARAPRSRRHGLPRA